MSHAPTAGREGGRKRCCGGVDTYRDARTKSGIEFSFNLQIQRRSVTETAILFVAIIFWARRRREESREAVAGRTVSWVGFLFRSTATLKAGGVENSDRGYAGYSVTAGGATDASIILIGAL